LSYPIIPELLCGVKYIITFVIYPLPTEMTQGKEKVIVRFEPAPGNIAGGVFDIRTLRSNNP